MDNTRKELVLNVVNPTSSPVNTAIVVSNHPTLAKQARVITLGHPNSSIENTLADKSALVPTDMQLTLDGPESPTPLLRIP